MTHRVEIPVYTDAWMKGDRYGEIVKIKNGKHGGPLVAKVLLGKTVKVCSMHS